MNKKKEYRDMWKKNNPIYMKLYKVLYRRYYKFRKSGGESIGIKITDMLGCSIMELSVHLESKWSEDMNWNNYGNVWDVDHVIPLSTDKTKDGFIRLNHYTNLQPLLKEEHKQKSKKEKLK